MSKTGVSSLTYVGHSQGTMQMLSALSEKADWFRPKLDLVVLMAPVSTMHRCNAELPHKVMDNPFFISGL
jgi:pimeloyl-ACP methyl ester carboxylesterase